MAQFFFCQCGEFSAEIKNPTLNWQAYSQLASLLSTGKCKIIDWPEENILRRVEIKLFAWASVYFILYSTDEGIRPG